MNTTAPDETGSRPKSEVVKISIPFGLYVVVKELANVQAKPVSQVVLWYMEEGMRSVGHLPGIKQTDEMHLREESDIDPK